MKYIKKSLLVMGWTLIFGGIIGTAGASEFGNIDTGQALFQMFACMGLGLACLGARWLLCRKRKGHDSM